MRDAVAPSPTLFVMVGLPAAGKTTRARELELEFDALRLTPDEWLIPLFGYSNETVARDTIEGRFVWLARRALRAGCSVIIDFGVWSRDERSALRSLALLEGARAELVYLEVDAQEQRRRLHERETTDAASTYPISDEESERYWSVFEPPTTDELSSTEIDPPPHGSPSWASWTASRWPTSFAPT